MSLKIKGVHPETVGIGVEIVPNITGEVVERTSSLNVEGAGLPARVNVKGL